MDKSPTLPNFIESVNLFPDGFFMQKHVPVVMTRSHNHNHVEVMLPIGCEIFFETHAGAATAKDQDLCLLWGQLPHRVKKVEGEGCIYIANLPLQEILALEMSDDIVEALISGQLIKASSTRQSDVVMFEGWVSDYESKHQTRVTLARTELICRLRRQSLSGWQFSEILMRAKKQNSKVAAKQATRIQRMIRFIAEHYTQPITIADISKAGGVSEGYGMSVFQKAIGMSMTSYLNKLRLYHAKSALLESQEKILTIAMDSGFGSLSRFYEVFTKDTGQTPQNFRLSNKI